MRILCAAGVLAGLAMAWLSADFGAPRFSECYLVLVATLVLPACWLRAANFGLAPAPAARGSRASRGARPG